MIDNLSQFTPDYSGLEPVNVPLGVYQGKLSVSCFSPPRITLDGGTVILHFKNTQSVPKELWPDYRGHEVPVTLTVFENHREQIEYDCVRRPPTEQEEAEQQR